MGAVATGEATKAGVFASAAELHEVFDRFLVEVDADPTLGPRLRSARVPHRFAFPDLDLVLNVTGSDDGEHCLTWEFSDAIEWTPALSLEMDSTVANRYLQGRENLAIAIARRRVRISCQEARAALRFLSSSRELIDCYRTMVAREYPHLQLK